MAAEICTLAAIRHTKAITAFMDDIIHVQNMEQLRSHTSKTFWYNKFQMQVKIHNTSNITTEALC